MISVFYVFSNNAIHPTIKLPPCCDVMMMRFGVPAQMLELYNTTHTEVVHLLWLGTKLLF